MRRTTMIWAALVTVAAVAVGTGVLPFEAGAKPKETIEQTITVSLTVRLPVTPPAVGPADGLYSPPAGFQFVIEGVSRTVQYPTESYNFDQVALNSLGVVNVGGPTFPPSRSYVLNDHRDNHSPVFGNFGSSPAFSSDPKCIGEQPQDHMYKITYDDNAVRGVVNPGEALGVFAYVQPGNPNICTDGSIHLEVTGHLAALGK